MERKYIKIMAINKNEPLWDVANKLGVTRSTLSKIISGVNVSPELAKKISEWHGAIDAATVLWGDDK
jgi:plasmid maintenance system antidote protein VapI